MLLKRNRLMFVFFLLLLLFGVGLFSYFFFLPSYIEKTILPNLGRQLSTTLSGRVYRIGFSSADFGEIILGDTLNPAVRLGSVHADYPFSTLLGKSLQQVKVNGFFLQLNILDGRLTLPGFDLDEQAHSQAGTEQKPSQGINLPFTLGRFQIDNGVIAVNNNGKRFLVPFDLQMNRIPGGGELAEYALHLQMNPQGEQITIKGTIDLSGNRSTLALIADSLDLGRFAHFADREGYTIHLGKVSIKGEAEIAMLPFQLVSASLKVDPELLYIGKMPVRLGKITPEEDSAISLEVKSSAEKWLVKARCFIREPLPASLELLGSISKDHDNVQGSGNVVFRNSGGAVTENHTQALTLHKDNPELHGGFVFTFDKSGAWKAALESLVQKQPGSLSQPLHIQYDRLSLQSEVPFFDLQGQGTAAANEIRLSLDIPKVQARYEGAEISVPKVSLRASYLQKEDSISGRTPKATVSLKLDGTKFQKKNLSGRADIFLQGEMVPQVANGSYPLQAQGRVTVANAAIKDNGSGVNLNSIESNVPWSWPATTREMSGEIKVSQMGWKGVNLGSFKADITLLDMMYSLNGNYRSTLLKGFVTNVSGTAGISRSTYSGELFLQSPMNQFAPINLGILDPSLEKSFFSGDLGLDTSLKFEAGRLKGEMQIKLQNGLFEFPEKNYTINGIGLSMLVPSLPDLRTAPAQTLQFNEATVGNLVLNKGRLVWQLESMDSVFLEEGVVQWAGGHVFTSAVRISSGMKVFVVPLFCDRLRLTDMLQQLGIHNAAGEGTVSGRIPLEIGKGTIRFEDGFLYSSPGHGGSVKVAALDLLAEGIPKNSQQFAQIDFAAEALKNFQYNWVKLLLDTKGEDLTIQMQMDGKPLDSLPFKYDSQTGLLQRIDDAGKGIKQPIRLDVNFRLPLNRFLGYSGKIQDILKNIK